MSQCANQPLENILPLQKPSGFCHHVLLLVIIILVIIILVFILLVIILIFKNLNKISLFCDLAHQAAIQVKCLREKI